MSLTEKKHRLVLEKKKEKTLRRVVTPELCGLVVVLPLAGLPRCLLASWERK